MPKKIKKAVSKSDKATKKHPKSNGTKKAKAPAARPAAKKAKPAPKAKKTKTPAKPKAEKPAKESKQSKRSAGKNGQLSSKLAELLKTPAKPKLGPGQSILDTQEGAEKLRELVKLAKEQGYLTFDDLNEHLPESVSDPDEMEIVMNRLRGMEIDIIDASQVDSYKIGPKGTERAKGRRGAREAEREARYPRRPGADVSEADGPGAAAHPRAGGRNLDAHRGRGAERAEARQPLRLHPPRVSGARAEADRRSRALRPRHSRQENREPRALHERPAAPDEAARCGDAERGEGVQELPRATAARTRKARATRTS